VVNEIVSEVQKNSEGKIDYLGFVTALRFNNLPIKPYNKKFRHRAAANPDMPCGAASIRCRSLILGNKPVLLVSAGSAALPSDKPRPCAACRHDCCSHARLRQVLKADAS